MSGYDNAFALAKLYQQHGMPLTADIFVKAFRLNLDEAERVITEVNGALKSAPTPAPNEVFFGSPAARAVPIHDTPAPAASVTNTKADHYRETVPAELKQERRWLVYRLVWNAERGKNDKKPFNPLTGQVANDSRLGISFEEALAHVQGYDGLGFYVEPPYLCIDIDGCRNPETGEIEFKALNLIRGLDTYTEASPSGSGVHIWAKGVKPGPVCRKGKIEIYDTGRFMTFTGIHVSESSKTVCERDITSAYRHMVAGEFETKTNQPSPGAPAANGESGATGVEIVRTGYNAGIITDKLTEKIELLTHGHITPGSEPFVVSNSSGSITYKSQSEADLALCTELAIKGLNADQIDKQFRESVLYRPKWEREDYRVNRTIAKAIASAERIKAEYEKRARKDAAADSLDTYQLDETESAIESGSTETQPEQTPKKEPKIVLAFETSDDVAVALRLGFNAVSATEHAETLRDKYDHVALFGNSAVATRLRDELNRFGNSAGFGIFPDDPANTYKGASGRLRCRPCKSLAEAPRHYSDAQLKEYLTQMLNRGFVREFELKAPKAMAIAPPQYPVPETRRTAEVIDAVLEKVDPATGKNYTVKRLVPPVAPQFCPNMFYGRAGDVALKIAEGTEAHAVSVCLSLLVALGNMMGKTDHRVDSPKRPHFRVKQSNEFSVHYTNEFLANVGSSSRGRKGTTESELLPLFRLIDSDWLRTRTCSGFASNQSIIYEVRDATSKKVYNRKTKEWETQVMPGVDDKRLLIQESELANLFLMARRDPRVSVTLRNGFDSKKLANRVMGKDEEGYNQSLYCAEPHLSILGSITPEELIETIPPGSVANGFGNRFLFCYIYRSQRVPSGGPTLDWVEDAKYFIKVVEFARTAGYVGLSQAAEKVWDRMYDRLEDNPLTGTAGELTRRAAAHVRRLALILTLIDMEKETESKHLLAAEAVWRYCQESVRFLFTGAMTREQAQILEYITSNPGTTRGQIRDRVFHRNKRASDVHALLADLLDTGRVRGEGEKLFKI
jgi:primase/DNA polymerase family protein/uncharacterized protein DUF3987